MLTAKASGRGGTRIAAVAGLLLLTVTGAAAAQRAAAGRRASADLAGARVVARDSARGTRPIAVAKWVALGATVAAAVYGYNENRLADSRYDLLEQLCQSEPLQCMPRTTSGGYVDADLESRYQSVRGLDRRATLGLVSAEVGVAATLALFLLDLRHAGGEPPNIPYRPPRLELGTRANGSITLGVRLPLRE